MNKMHQTMQQGLAEQVYPGASLIVSKENRIVFNEFYGVTDIVTGQAVTENTVYDLASLTKPLATTIALMLLVSHKKIKVDQNLGQILPEYVGTDKERILIHDLLCHTSGLPDYKPYYKVLKNLPIQNRKHELRELIFKEPLLNTIGQKTVYSDLGFMLLEQIIEKISETRLDNFLEQNIYSKMGLSDDLFFIDMFDKKQKANEQKANVRYASTENCPWRNCIINGNVHDDNAYVIGGICGHAGLFGTAKSVHKLIYTLLMLYKRDSTLSLDEPECCPLNTEIVRYFLKKQDGTHRRYGFDTPTQPSSSGDLFSENSIGHLGFTGTSFWVDLDRSIIVVLLTNRVHPSRTNEKIKVFRPLIHNRIMESLIK